MILYKKQCDRCKREYFQDNESGEHFKGCKIHDFQLVVYANTEWDSPIHLDLCNNCASAFSSWFKANKNEVVEC